MTEDVCQLDDILVCAIKCRREQVAQIVRENFPCVDTCASAQLFHFRPNLISRHGLAAFGAKDRAGGGFFCVANLSSLRQNFDGNEKSKRVIEKCGFSYQLTCERPALVDDALRPTLFYALTKEKWEKTR